MVNADLIIGPRKSVDGVLATTRGDKFLDAAITMGRGGYYADPTLRGTVYQVSTAAAGYTTGAGTSGALTAAGNAIGLWNPVGSGVNAIIMKTSLGYVSGILSYGTIVYGQYAQTTTPGAGTAIVPTSNVLGNTAGQCKAYSGVTAAGVPTILRPAYIFGPYAGAAGFSNPTYDYVHGEYVVPPGNMFIMSGLAAGAGSSPLCIFGIEYSEEAV